MLRYFSHHAQAFFSVAIPYRHCNFRFTHAHIFLAAIFCAYGMGASAQVRVDASQLTDLRPLQYIAQFVIEKPLREIDISGNTQIPTVQLQEKLQDFLGKNVSASDVEEMRTRLSRLYIDQGYLNSGALFVMPSTPQTDSLQFKIIEGRLLEVRAQGLQGLDASYIKRRLPDRSQVLNMNSLREQFQLLLQDPLFERIQSRLLPTGELGQAILELDVLRKPVYSFSVYANNYRSPAIGEAVIGTTAVIRNLSGGGDAFDVQIGKSHGAVPYHIGWTVPFSDPNRSIQISWDHGRSSVVEAPLDLVDIHSQTKAIEFKLSQMLVNTLARRVDLSLAFASKQTRSSLLGEDFSFSPGEINGRSTAQVLKFSQDWSERSEKTGLLARSVFHFGRNNNQIDHGFDVSDSDAQLVPPRQYWYWSGQLQWLRQLPDWNAQVVFRSQWQWSPSRLIPMEKMALGGNATVRGFRESSLLRDQGQMLGLEFHKDLFSDAAKALQISGLVFVDLGRGKNYHETAQTLSSVGIGVKAQSTSWFADLVVANRSQEPATMSGQKRSTWQDKGVQLQIGYKFN
ncbi:ShlB/FhaC/HecB family hemolysin secretion/activation protein [Undibacterium sp. Di24W]|uniref:ShlB/FhaC/HecB family hemolysin secretion/activation protein n=1 Tax=Undibacterium sp. Di24W TaxID=3413033 RepID=UPI003BF13393